MEDATEEAELLCLVLVNYEEAGSVPLLITRLLIRFPHLALAVPFNESVL